MTDQKAMCPYGTACDRQNSIHLRATAHPHLVKLLDDNLEDMPIRLPNTLDFACNNRSALIGQLKILRKIRREKTTNRKTFVPIIVLTGEDESPDSSQLKDEKRYKNSANMQRRVQNYKHTQYKVEHDNTKRSIENYKHTQRKVKNNEKTKRRVENRKLKRLTLKNAKNTQPKVENYEKSQCKVENYEKSQCKVEPKIESSPSEREEMLRMMRARGEASAYVPTSGKFVNKLKLAAPYYIFYTALQNVQLTWTQALPITMPELLDKSLGKITRSLHLTCIIDIHWLLCQYKVAEQTTDMLILFSQMKGNSHQQSIPDKVKIKPVDCCNENGVHNSKVSIMQYEDGGIRIIVSSANLYREDWELRTQGLWISPHLPLLPEGVSYLPSYGESPTGFKGDFLAYLRKYKIRMARWHRIIQKCDFTTINVVFVSSVPGVYPVKIRRDMCTRKSQVWGHRKLAKVLEAHVVIPHNEPRTKLIAQTSSVGFIGGAYHNWVGSELVHTMSKTTCTDDYTHADFQFVIPSVEDYKGSYDMMNKSTCVSYTEICTEHRWINSYLRKWKASCSGRTKAMPNVNTFTRISGNERLMWWFLMGSPNLSKAAWGWKRGRVYRLNNYEASVLFLPKFLTGQSSFPIGCVIDSTTPCFPIPYDLPLTRYDQLDSPHFTGIVEFIAQNQKGF